MNIGDYSEVLRFMIVKDLQEDLILGRSWLSKHNPVIDFETHASDGKDPGEFGNCIEKKLFKFKSSTEIKNQMEQIYQL
jgi:hypothetical protein